MTGEVMDEEQNGDGVKIEGFNALATIARADIDVQIATAKQYPRSVAHFKKTALMMATLDEETSASCFYTLKRRGKDGDGDKEIQGGSIRLAEIIGAAWTNLRYGARVVGQDARFVTSQGACHDLETNVAISVEVQRRITYKPKPGQKIGDTFSDDMIVVTANAACSLALRNAILRVVPKAYWGPVLDAAKKVAIGDARTLVRRRQDAIDYWCGKAGVEKERVLATLGRSNIEDITLEDLETLLGFRTAIKDGDSTLDECFPPIAKAAASKAEEKLKGNGTVPRDRISEPEKPPSSPEKSSSKASPEAGATTTAPSEGRPESEKPEQSDRPSTDEMDRQDIADLFAERCNRAESTAELDTLRTEISRAIFDRKIDLEAKERLLEGPWRKRYSELAPATAGKRQDRSTVV